MAVPTWLTISPTSGTGNTSVTLSTNDYNLTGSSRSGTFTVTTNGGLTKTITVTQSALGYQVYGQSTNTFTVTSDQVLPSTCTCSVTLAGGTIGFASSIWIGTNYFSGVATTCSFTSDSVTVSPLRIQFDTGMLSYAVNAPTSVSISSSITVSIGGTAYTLYPKASIYSSGSYADNLGFTLVVSAALYTTSSGTTTRSLSCSSTSRTIIIQSNITLNIYRGAIL